MTSPVQNKQQISVSLKIDTSGEINPTLDALAENLRYFHSLHGKSLTLEVDSGWSNSIVVPAGPVSTVVTHILAASDAAILPHYSAPPCGRPWAPRVAAGVKQLKQHQYSQRFKVQVLASSRREQRCSFAIFAITASLNAFQAKQCLVASSNCRCQRQAFVTLYKKIKPLKGKLAALKVFSTVLKTTHQTKKKPAQAGFNQLFAFLLTLKQAQHVLFCCISLSQHCGGGLLQDLCSR